MNHHKLDAQPLLKTTHWLPLKSTQILTLKFHFDFLDLISQGMTWEHQAHYLTGSGTFLGITLLESGKMHVIIYKFEFVLQYYNILTQTEIENCW